MGIADLDYYRRRVAEESLAAKTTSCAHARDVHLDLAERYSAKLRLIAALSVDVPPSPAEAVPARPVVPGAGEGIRRSA